MTTSKQNPRVGQQSTNVPITVQPKATEYQYSPGNNESHTSFRNIGYVPPGLVALSVIDHILVHQQVEPLEVILGIECKNKYKIKNNLGQDIYFAAEGEEVIQLTRSSDCFLQKLEVQAPIGEVVGFVDEECSCCTPEFTIKNVYKEPILRITGPGCIECVSEADFDVLTLDGRTKVGKISKKWSGLLKELFTDADNFEITFPMNLSVDMKAVLLGACFLIDLKYFETDVSALKLPNSFKSCVEENEIDLKSKMGELNLCVNEKLELIVENLASAKRIDHIHLKQQNNMVMDCLDMFKEKIKDCLHFKDFNNLLQGRAIDDTEKAPITEGVANTTLTDVTTKSTVDIASCVVNFASDASNCTQNKTGTLMEECNMPLKNGSIDLHWKPIESEENETEYCNRESEKSKCVTIMLDTCTVKKARNLYQNYFYCIWVTGTCKKIIDEKYIYLLPADKQPKRSWMTNHAPNINPLTCLYFSLLLFFYCLI